MSRRRNLALLILAAVATQVLGLAPSLCHAEDPGCRADANHHTDLSCHCSCHMAIVLPCGTAGAPARPAAVVAPRSEPAAASLSSARLDRPPRR